jgi:hypothetical protein
MTGTRKRSWLAWCTPVLALLLAFGSLGSLGTGVAAAQSSADEAEMLLAAASELADEREPVDSPRTLDLEQAESSSITVNFLNPADEPIADFYLSFRAEAPRDGDDEPFDIGVYFRDQGNDEPYLNLILLSSADNGPRWGIFNEEGNIESGDLDEDVFPIEEGSRYNVELAVIGDEAAFAINGEPIALIDISDNPVPGRISLASGLFGDTQIDGDIVEVSRISLVNIGDDDATTGEEEGEGSGEETGSGDAEIAESDLYGFTVAFDPDVWELREITQTGQDYNSLGLANVEILNFVDGTTQVLMFAGASEDTARQCVDRDIEYFDGISTRYDLVGVAEDEDGEPIEGRTESGDGYYTVVYLDDNGPADEQLDEPEAITVYIECRPIADGESMILIEHYARDAQYNDAIEGRIALLAGIDVSGSRSGSEEEDEPIEEEEPTEEADEPVDGIITVIIEGDVEGEATIDASGSTRSRIDVIVDGADEGALVVIQEGSCRRLAGEAAFEVDEIDDQGEASGRIRITPESLVGEYAITIIDADTEDFENPLGCGDIE